MTRRDDAIRILQPFIEKAGSFSGWNFDDLNVTRAEPSTYPGGRNCPWDYIGLAREHARTARRIIDFGTGGGEVYARIVEGIDARFVASEEWHVNAPVARDHLRPLGVDVIHAQSERPPLCDATFGLALSRHEAIDPAEVVRILRPGGVCITQQVAKEQWQEFADVFPHRTTYPDHINTYRAEFEAAGCAVEVQHEAWRAIYPSIGEVAFMLMVAPWEVPDFDPVRDVDALLALDDRYGDERGIVLTLARYLMVARKP
jgi:SAM-dependent methyltransferase